MTFEIFKDRRGEYRWRLRAINGKVLADSGEGYKRRSDVTKVIARIQAQAAGAKTADVER